jgi:hypothetical protein
MDVEIISLPPSEDDKPDDGQCQAETCSFVFSLLCFR